MERRYAEISKEGTVRTFPAENRKEALEHCLSYHGFILILEEDLKYTEAGKKLKKDETP